MATKRGGSWEGAVNYKGQRFRRSFGTEQEADLWQLDSKAKLIRGEPIDMGEKATARRNDGKPYTLTELIEHVYRTHWAPMSGGEKAMINARSIVGIIGASKPIIKLTKMDIDNARAELLKAGNAPATVNRKVAALSKCMSEAEDMGIVEAKPKFARYKESEHRIRRFTVDEETKTLRFFERISQQDMADYVVISLDAGLRQGEVLDLAFDDCEGDRFMVWGTGSKSGKSRTVKMTERAKAIVKRRRGEIGGRKLFPTLNKWSIHHYWDRLSETLGLDDDKQFVPHILRHEFCSRLASAGVNAAAIQQLAGHSSMAVTQRYVHLFGGDLDTAIDALEPAKVQASTDAMDVLADVPQELLERLAKAGLLRLPQQAA